MYKKIMVPLDGSKLAECALPHLESVVKGSPSAEVIIVQAVEPISIPYGLEATKFSSVEQLQAFETHQKSAAERYTGEIISRLAKAGVTAKAQIVYGKAGESLADFASKNGVDLVIMASHGRSGISRRIWGSVADHVLRSILIPVLIVRSPECGPVV